MHRFFVTESLVPGALVTLCDEDSRHARDVLRLRAGDAVVLLDGRTLFSGVVQNIGGARVTARADAELPSPEPIAQITLYQGMPKADKLEFIVQKATELGVVSVVPVLFERSIRRPEQSAAKRAQERLERIAREAAKQSGRACVPIIGAPTDVKTLSSLLQDYDMTLLPWEDAHGVSLRGALETPLPRAARIALIIGPEGGVSPTEAECLQHAGAVVCTLGARILRTETAAVAAMAIALNQMGDMA